MPKIEIRGFSTPFDLEELFADWGNMGDARILRRKIFNALSGTAFIDDLVVEIVYSDVRSQKRVPKPYIIVQSTRPDECEEIVRILATAGIRLDTEVARTLIRFFEASDMTPEGSGSAFGLV